MSLGVWGDEGNIAEYWSDTEMYFDLAIIQHKLKVFMKDYKNEIPNKETEQLLEIIDDKLQEIFDTQLSGKI